MKLASIITAGILSVAMGSAQAAIFDNGTYTTDTASGLDWLDVTQTMGLSFDQVSAQIANGDLLGWRYATGAEFNQLITDATGVVIPTGSLAVPNNSPYFLDLIHMLGPTTSVIDACCGEGGRLVSWEFVQGWLDESPKWINIPPSLGSPYITTADLIYFDGDGHSIIYINGGSTTNSAVPQFGSYLVRDTSAASIPEPQSYALMLTGLGLLGLTSKRRKQILSS